MRAKGKAVGRSVAFLGRFRVERERMRPWSLMMRTESGDELPAEAMALLPSFVVGAETIDRVEMRRSSASAGEVEEAVACPAAASDGFAKWVPIQYEAMASSR